MPKQVRTKPVSAPQVRAYAGKANEYADAAATEHEAGRNIAATSLAIHAAINAADAVCGARLGKRAAGDDHDQVLELRRGHPLGLQRDLRLHEQRRVHRLGCGDVAGEPDDRRHAVALVVDGAAPRTDRAGRPVTIGLPVDNPYADVKSLLLQVAADHSRSTSGAASRWLVVRTVMSRSRSARHM